MKTNKMVWFMPVLIFWGMLVSGHLFGAEPDPTGTQPAPETYLIQNARIVTVTGPVIERGSVLISMGKIAGVGTSVPIPPGAKVIDASGLSVFPGMINAGTVVGLAEVAQVAATMDTSEIGDNNANIHVDIAIRPDSSHVAITRVNGITTVLTEPRGGLIAGQSALINLDGWVPQEMILKSPAAMHINWPNALPFVFGSILDIRTRTVAEARREQERQISSLKRVLRDARAYAVAKDAEAKDAGLPKQSVDLKLEALIPVVSGQMPVIIHASSERDIKSAIDLADEMKLKMILADGEEAYRVADKLKTKNIPVIIMGPLLTMPFKEDDPYDLAFANASLLSKAGVKIAFQTLDVIWESRNLPYHAGTAAAFGLPKEEALKAVTIYPAEIFGVADRIGSIESGKLANLIVTDGDPLEIRTQVKFLFINGRQVSLATRQTELYEKYEARR